MPRWKLTIQLSQKLTWIWTVSELDLAIGGQDKEWELRQERGLSVQAPKTSMSFQNWSVLLLLFIFSLLAKIVLIPKLACDIHPTSRWRNLKKKIKKKSSILGWGVVRGEIHNIYLIEKSDVPLGLCVKFLQNQKMWYNWKKIGKTIEFRC